MVYYLGCSGWYYWHWKDLFYKDIPQNKWFSFYYCGAERMEGF